MNWDSSPAKVFSDNPMTSITDRVVIFYITAVLIIFDAAITLLSIFKKRVCLNKSKRFTDKTNKEPKKILTGLERITNLNNKQLVNLILVS